MDPSDAPPAFTMEPLPVETSPIESFSPPLALQPWLQLAAPTDNASSFANHFLSDPLTPDKNAPGGFGTNAHEGIWKMFQKKNEVLLQHRDYCRRRARRHEHFAEALIADTKTGLPANEKLQLLRVREEQDIRLAELHLVIARQTSDEADKIEGLLQARKEWQKNAKTVMSALLSGKKEDGESLKKAAKKYHATLAFVINAPAVQNALLSAGNSLHKHNEELRQQNVLLPVRMANYQKKLEKFSATTDIWDAQMKLCCDLHEQREAERIEFLCVSVYDSINRDSAMAVAAERKAEMSRNEIKNIDVRASVSTTAIAFATGTLIPQAPTFQPLNGIGATIYSPAQYVHGLTPPCTGWVRTAPMPILHVNNLFDPPPTYPDGAQPAAIQRVAPSSPISFLRGAVGQGRAFIGGLS